MKHNLKILRNDPWLEPFADAIVGRHDEIVRKLKSLTADYDGSIADFP